ncbi:MAG: sulfotransferase [Candidatus Binatia bacterium]
MAPIKHSNNARRTVVVLGLARSGTSVVTGMLRILGVDMGPSREDNSNPRGSHEDVDFAKFHKEVFDLAGDGKDYWNPPSREAVLELRPKVDAAVRALLAKKRDGQSLWGWKHPRSLLTYELFLPYLENSHFVLVFRNPLSTALSSVAHTRKFRHPLNLSQALRLVHFYHGEMLRVLKNHPDIPTQLVSYEDVIVDPRKEAARIARFLGIEISDEIVGAITEFVIPRDRLPLEKKKRRSFLLGKLPELIRNGRRKLASVKNPSIE